MQVQCLRLSSYCSAASLRNSRVHIWQYCWSTSSHLDFHKLLGELLSIKKIEDTNRRCLTLNPLPLSKLSDRHLQFTKLPRNNRGTFSSVLSWLALPSLSCRSNHFLHIKLLFPYKFQIWIGIPKIELSNRSVLYVYLQQKILHPSTSNFGGLGSAVKSIMKTWKQKTWKHENMKTSCNQRFDTCIRNLLFKIDA